MQNGQLSVPQPKRAATHLSYIPQKNELRDGSLSPPPLSEYVKRGGSQRTKGERFYLYSVWGFTKLSITNRIFSDNREPRAKYPFCEPYNTYNTRTGTGNYTHHLCPLPRPPAALSNTTSTRNPNNNLYMVYVWPYEWYGNNHNNRSDGSPDRRQENKNVL